MTPPRFISRLAPRLLHPRLASESGVGRLSYLVVIGAKQHLSDRLENEAHGEEREASDAGRAVVHR